MRPPLHRRAPKTARRAALHRMSDSDSENQAPSLDHRVGAAILHALTAIGYAVTSDTRLTMASNIPSLLNKSPDKRANILLCSPDEILADSAHASERIQVARQRFLKQRTFLWSLYRTYENAR